MSEFRLVSPNQPLRVAEVLNLAEEAEVGFPVGYSLAQSQEGYPQDPGIVLGLPSQSNELAWKFIPESRVAEVVATGVEIQRFYRTSGQASRNIGAHDFVHINVDGENHNMRMVIWESMQSLRGVSVDEIQPRRPLSNAVRNLTQKQFPALYKEGSRMAAAYEYAVLVPMRPKP